MADVVEVWMTFLTMMNKRLSASSDARLRFLAQVLFGSSQALQHNLLFFFLSPTHPQHHPFSSHLPSFFLSSSMHAREATKNRRDLALEGTDEENEGDDDDGEEGACGCRDWREAGKASPFFEGLLTFAF